MQTDDSVLKVDNKSLSDWHLQLGITVSALKCFSSSNQVDLLDDEYSDLVFVIQHRLDELVESFPLV